LLMIKASINITMKRHDRNREWTRNIA